MKRTVLLVVRWPVGGIRTYLKYVYPSVLRRGWNAVLIGPPTVGADSVLKELGPLGMQLVWHQRATIQASLIASVRVALRKNSIDVVHSHGLTSALLSAVPVWSSRIPHVATLHDVFLDSTFSGVRGMARRTAVAFGLRLVTCVQAVSGDAASNLTSHITFLGRKPGRLTVIRNGIRVADFLDVEPRDLRSELVLSPERTIVGFLGRFMSQKGFQDLIDAIGLISKQGPRTAVPVVAAFGSGEYVREDRDQIERRGLSDYFRFLPAVESAAATLKGLDVLAIPSRWEACPLLPMEAMCAGVPIIGTSCIGLREVLEGSPAVMVSPRSPEQLADALRASAVNRERARMAAAAYVTTAASRFSADRTAGELCDLLERLSETR